MKNIILLIILLLGFSFNHLGQSGSDNYSSDSSIVKIPKPIQIVDINYEIERTRKKLLKMSYELEDNQQFVELDSLLAEQKIFMLKEAGEFKQFNPHNLSKYFLENTYRAWSSYNAKIKNWMELVNDQVAKSQKNLDELGLTKEVWELTLENGKDMDSPLRLIESISEVIDEIDELETNFLSYRREMIIREDNANDLISYGDDIIVEVNHLQQDIRDNLFVASKPNLWETKFSSDDFFPLSTRLKKAYRENAKTIRNFAEEFNFTYTLLFILLIVFSFFLIRRAYSKLGLTETDANFVVVRRVFYDHPISTLTALIITLLVILNPTIPLIIIGVMGVILLICTYLFMPEMIGKKGKIIILMVLVLNLFNLSQILVWYFGNFSRLFITVEALLAMYLTYKYGLQGFKRYSKKAAPFTRFMWILSVFLFSVFTIALFSNLLGYLNMSVLMLKIGVKTAGIVVVIYGVHAILRAIILAGIDIGRATNLKLMASRWDAAEKRLLQIINLLAVLFLFTFFLQNMDIYRPIMDWFSDFLSHEWVIGTMQLSIGSILSFILILLVSFGLANFTKVVIEDGILVHTRLPKGVPAAISVTIRYFIIVLGLSMALSAAGIDLGKFGLLAGALGVGIGFGLQNIVNNFISGLILVYERPVNVGDTVEVETLMGIVNRIGVRSSNVRTFDGAEVVVPNGNLISNQLVNWTLSDNQRRVELKIGAAYGSDPNVVLELLRKVAHDNEDVLDDPEPLALFEEFGDSSLNFRLLFWVPFQKGLGVKSDIAIGVYNIFAENGVEIPFPQVDLHVKEENKEPLIVAKASTTDSSDDTPIDKTLLSDSIEKNEET